MSNAKWGWALGLGILAFSNYFSYGLGHRLGHEAGLQDAPERFAYLAERAEARETTDRIKASRPEAPSEFCERII